MKKIVLVALMALCAASFADNVDQDIMNKKTAYNYYLMEKAAECMLDKCNGNSQCNRNDTFDDCYEKIKKDIDFEDFLQMSQPEILENSPS